MIMPGYINAMPTDDLVTSVSRSSTAIYHWHYLNYCEALVLTCVDDNSCENGVNTMTMFLQQFILIMLLQLSFCDSPCGSRCLVPLCHREKYPFTYIKSSQGHANMYNSCTCITRHSVYGASAYMQLSRASHIQKCTYRIPEFSTFPICLYGI